MDPIALGTARGHVRVARVLLQYGADPAAHNNMNRVPFQEASAGGYRLITQLLSNYKVE